MPAAHRQERTAENRPDQAAEPQEATRLNTMRPTLAVSPPALQADMKTALAEAGAVLLGAVRGRDKHA